MKNITTDDFRFSTLCWSTASVFIIGIMFGTVVLMRSYDHKFDATCINAGKSVIYKALEGDDSSKKVCQ